MNWDAIGAVGEVIGALVVFLTLLYLARQVSESRKASQTQTEDSIITAWNNSLENWGDDLEVSKIMANGLSDFNSLSQPEKMMFHMRCNSLMLEYNRQRNLYERGSWDWNIRDLVEDCMLALLISKGGAQWWEAAGHWYLYQDHFNRQISERGKQISPLSQEPWLKVEGN